jgi:hypothetical protein
LSDDRIGFLDLCDGGAVTFRSTIRSGETSGPPVSDILTSTLSDCTLFIMIQDDPTKTLKNKQTLKSKM